jgi:hypothetical protein
MLRKQLIMRYPGSLLPSIQSARTDSTSLQWMYGKLGFSRIFLEERKILLHQFM